MRCCAGEEGLWLFGVALRREVPNQLMLRWLTTVVLSDEKKASQKASGGDQEGERKRIVADVSKPTEMTSKPGCFGNLGMSLAGVRSLASVRSHPSWLSIPSNRGDGVMPLRP
jgi:hypothetical protein